MISRAASRTSSEAPAPFSVPSITAFSFSRVRSDAGILSIGVLLSQRPAQYRSSLIANQARVHPNPFPSKLRTSPVYRVVERYWRRMLCSRSWAGRRLTWDAFNQIKERTPLLPPKLRLPYSELQALAVL